MADWLAAIRDTMILRGTEVISWGLIAAAAAAAACLMASSGLSFDWASGLRPLLPCLGCMMGAFLYRTWRPDERIATTFVAVAQILAFSAVAETLSYAVAGLGGPLWDARFLAWDRALGLDWRAYLDLVNAHPVLAFAYGLAYRSLIIQIVFVAAVLGLIGRYAACRVFVLAVAMSGLATVAISGFMPAISMFVHLGIDPGTYANIDASAAYAPLTPMTGLRSGAIRAISLSQAEGIIAFPSFHAALGVIFIAMYWPIRWARWPGLALNALLLAATPVNGGHYFVDVFAGAAVALAAVAVARSLDRRAINRERRFDGPALPAPSAVAA